MSVFSMHSSITSPNFSLMILCPNPFLPCSYLAGWIDMCFSSYFTALDHPIRSLLVSLFGTLIFPIAFLFLLTAFWGLNGVWLMSCAAALASGILTLILARTLKI